MSETAHAHDEHGHGHGAHGHSHGLVARSIVSSRDGLRAVSWSLLVLLITALLQIGVFALTSSVALLADLAPDRDRSRSAARRAASQSSDTRDRDGPASPRVTTKRDHVTQLMHGQHPNQKQRRDPQHPRAIVHNTSLISTAPPPIDPRP